MSIITTTMLIASLTGLYVAAAWLDHKFAWRLIDWANGNCNSPFAEQKSTQLSSKDKDELILQLKERMQVLEKIVTEPSYELNKKINQL